MYVFLCACKIILYICNVWSHQLYVMSAVYVCSITAVIGLLIVDVIFHAMCFGGFMSALRLQLTIVYKMSLNSEHIR